MESGSLYYLFLISVADASGLDDMRLYMVLHPDAHCHFDRMNPPLGCIVTLSRRLFLTVRVSDLS